MTNAAAPSAMTRTGTGTARYPSRDWKNILFLASAHALAVVAIVYMAAVHFSWWTLGLGVVWFALCGLSITGGYHRLFSHRAYRAGRALRALYLFFGAAAVQNSALKWSIDHRRHHTHTDSDDDPYNIRHGFWWAHVGWVLYQDEEPVTTADAPADLLADPLVRWQDRYYVWLAVLVTGILPLALGLIWGDPIGALLVAGFLRLAIQWHATFAVNSLAHSVGSQPYCKRTSARDSLLTAFVTLGEGYHNFHHRFQADYRNGVRWYHLDPTKWFVWTMAKFGVTWDLHRTPAHAILRARTSVRSLAGA